MPRHVADGVRVEVVEFNGVTFRRYPDAKQPSHRRYFSPNGTHRKAGVQALHQEVWKSVHGPIPPGHHIHHRNGDLADNSIGNLECMAPRDHAAEHAEARRDFGQSPEQLAHLDRIRGRATEWHRSDEGRAWHAEHARSTSANAAKTHCKRGHEFTPENTRIRPTGRSCKTCHRDRMRAAYHRARVQPDDE